MVDYTICYCSIRVYENLLFKKFFDASWGQHVHGLSATLWYAFVIYQPYLITKKEIKKHKKYGIYGVFLAGLVVASAMAMIPNNIVFAESGVESPIAPPFFVYGVSFFDIVSIVGFGVSVIIAIRKSRNLDDHAIWMISTVFWALMPALTRLALVPMFWMDKITHFANLAMLTTPLILISIIAVMVKLKKMHPALIAVFIGNLSVYLIEPLGKADWWVELATKIFST